MKSLFQDDEDFLNSLKKPSSKEVPPFQMTSQGLKKTSKKGPKDDSSSEKPLR